MRKKLIVTISIAVVAILTAIFILGYNTENDEKGKSSIIDTINATKGKEINIFLHDGVGASDNP